MAELRMKMCGEQDGLSVGRVSCRPQGWSRTLKRWHSFEIAIADAEGFNVRRRQHGSIRFGEDVEVRRSHQAVACMKRCVQELGRPVRLPDVIRYDDNEARRGNPDTELGVNLSGVYRERELKPKAEEPRQSGGSRINP